MKKIYIFVLFFLIFLLVLVNVLLIPSPNLNIATDNISTSSSTHAFEANQPRPTASIKFASLISYPKPEIKTKGNYVVILLGDSMTDVLRTHEGFLVSQLTDYYSGSTFNILNYGYGSTNILSVRDRLENETNYINEYFDPINEIDFDIIFVESFGHNPLYGKPLDQLLAEQGRELIYIHNSLKEHHPNSHVVFVATIAPNRENYAKHTVELTQEQRDLWVNERVAFIENHIKFAEEHNIPLLNIYKKSIGEGGSGNLIYIRDSDFIHPSAEGVRFIYGLLGDYIIDNNLLPY